MGYDSGIPDELRYARLQQRNERKRLAKQSDETRKRTAATPGENQAEADVLSQVTVEAADEEHNEDTVELTALERKESLSLKCEIAELKTEIVGLQREISAQKSESTALKAENVTLKKELDELKKTTAAIFTEGFLKEKENETILKFYTGTL